MSIKFWVWMGRLADWLGIYIFCASIVPQETKRSTEKEKEKNDDYTVLFF